MSARAAARTGRPLGATEARLARWRSELGASTRLWRGTGVHRVAGDHWLTLSGSSAVDYNVACCHSGDPEVLEQALAEVSAARRPAIVMVAGAALGNVRHLAEAGWVCIGTDPFMRLGLAAAGERCGGAAPAAYPLDLAGLALLRSVIEASFAVTPELAELALPDAAATDSPRRDPDLGAWGLFDGGRLVSGTALVRAGDSVCVWSMATPPELQGLGYGRKLLAAALEHARRSGARHCLLISSPAGERLYGALGFDVLEHWQMWTRPRWVLA